ncbi:hypothetical protein [Cellulomonas humilata]|uniref:Gram-positive cocci surface proteins LPxTG domain-containing protein n=1 Tax=Cellulomonas humilata TaxID=144055 RepID=A0ABU0EHJ5_9CELL|nr:hypothetical protein [Cellulomonas humilata]MDQ0374742.1 hypothetical protein [Cellulomonas humilata]
MHTARTAAAVVLLAAALVGGGAATAFAASDQPVATFQGLQLPDGHELGAATEVVVTYTFRGVSDSVRLLVGDDLGHGSYLPWSAVAGLPTDSCVTSVVLSGDAERDSYVGRAPVCGIDASTRTVGPPETVTPPVTVTPESVVPPETVAPAETVPPETMVPWTAIEVDAVTPPVEPRAWVAADPEPQPVAVSQSTVTTETADAPSSPQPQEAVTTSVRVERLAQTGSDGRVYGIAAAALVGVGAALVGARKRLAHR